jgi:predicted alpha/beta-hydrolase family hydrolase
MDGDAPKEFSFETPAGELPGLWTGAVDAIGVMGLAHGAGAGMRHPFMEGVSDGLVRSGIATLRFDFPYMARGRRSPDRPAVLIDAWRGALDDAMRRADGLPVAAGGKSLGGRMASMLVAEEGERFAGRALVFFGYPLHAPGRVDQPRDGHLSSIAVPMLFIEGTQDQFARFDLISAVVGKLAPLASMHVVEGGDHSFRVSGRRRGDDEIGRDLAAIAGEFIRGVAAGA